MTTGTTVQDVPGGVVFALQEVRNAPSYYRPAGTHARSGPITRTPLTSVFTRISA